MGKTELVRQALQLAGDIGVTPCRAVWLSPSGAPSDVSRFWLQLAVAVSDHTGNKELLSSLRRGGAGAESARGRVLAASADRNLVVVLDNADGLSESDRPAALALLSALHIAGARTIGIGGLDLIGVSADREMTAVSIGGLTPEEALEFWQILGKRLDGAASIAALFGLVHQVGGHPEVLRLAASKCDAEPSGEAITAIATLLPGGTQRMSSARSQANCSARSPRKRRWADSCLASHCSFTASTRSRRGQSRQCEATRCRGHPWRGRS